MKTSTIYAILFMLIMSIIAINVAESQDISTNYNCSAIYNESTGAYDVKLTGVTQAAAVNMLVDQIKQSTLIEHDMQVFDYTVSYAKKMYTVDLTANVTGSDREGYPMQFETLAEVKKHVKACIKYLLDNL